MSGALAWVIIIAILAVASVINTALRAIRDARVAKHTGQLPDQHREAAQREHERQFWGHN